MTNRTIQAHDFMSLTSRKMTDEGYLIAPGNLARTGVQEYRAFELGLDADGMDPMKVIRLHRPADEVFNPASMASFESKPITIEHPKEAVTADNWSELAKGEVRDVTRSGDLMTATLLVRAKDAIEAVQTGKVQLSNGYTFELDMTSGQTADGRTYDGIQRNIRGNHVALVDAARCGSACRIADSQTNITTKGKTMTDAKRKVAVDGIPLEVEDTSANVIETLVGQRNEARDALAKLQPTASKAVELQTALDKANADIEQLKKDVITPAARDAMVAGWSAMLATAKRLVPEITTDGKTCHAIRREVIATVSGKDATAKAVADAVLAGKALDVADEEHVRATFNALAASVKTEAGDAATGNDSALAAALVGDGSGKQTTNELTGRDKFMAQSTQAWQQK